MDVVGRTSFGYELGSVSGLRKGVVPPVATASEFIMSEMTR